MPDYTKVNRVEVIDHTASADGVDGRAYVLWKENPVKLEFSLQDDDRTLKIFIRD